MVYSIGIALFGLVMRLAALFNDKAHKAVKGRKGLFDKLEAFMSGIDTGRNPVIWFHVSSLGEFEQGRPVIEAIRKKWPGKKILLTFFSPSGYEVRKNYDQADFVSYMPLDTPGNARRFLEIVKPELVVFVKYDFWFNFMSAISEREIPLIYISVLFRRDQHFFRWYGGWTRKHLKMVNRFFVQNQESETLLREIGITRVELAGDTRFDRVYAIARQAKPISLVGQFCRNHPVFIAGSCWEPDETVFLPLVNDPGSGMKYILAPHDTRPERVNRIREQITRKVLLYSELNGNNAETADILIIDSVGILNQLYQYASVAFIGGGFGSGLHNIQEPVTFGVPVFFGPVFGKFREATELVSLGGVFTVKSTTELREQLVRLLGDQTLYKAASGICRQYVEQNRGATEKIMEFLENH